MVRRDDGESISPQYLNDIVKQFADALNMEADWLYFLAGRFPEDIRSKKLSEKDVAQAMRAFRGGGKGKGKG